MTTTSTDAETLKMVHDELERASGDDASAIVARVHDGIVTLTGGVDSYPQRIAAKNAALRVAPVIVVMDEINVIGEDGATRDAAVAEEVRTVLLSWSVAFGGSVRACLRDGVVTLKGRVGSDGDRDSVALAVSGIGGVRRLDNLVEITR